eukprot:CAMPEP_0119108616 /NCGR_PEP_ID=MMETSP1180-20130426/15466_1 /TAXON_ID=3052 ORGANISM="Chlamydomonas cf sp, Strain CCMP681" /NCGR_SAMPLE_ID=MMETSP1180 /ASSEMBLY_ACC=CAM_ASM_000741 /LENGTH=335 /DNA_ID=CAMNT_0007094249 /DNA_START=45 /DNA_END=1052 /DNA_ORIENTATION=+
MQVSQRIRTRCPAGQSQGQRTPLSVRASSSAVPAVTKTVEAAKLDLADSFAFYKKAPPSQKWDAAKEIATTFRAAKAAGALPRWGAALENIKRRNVFQNELRQVGIKDPGMIAIPSARNEQAFMLVVVGTTSVGAVAAGAFLPGQWGFWGQYLIGGISFAVLAIGSTVPGVLQFAIDKFSLVFPDYKDRVVRHEAAHFLIGYLTACPVTSYSLLLGEERVEFAEARIGKRLIEKTLEDEEIDSLAAVAVAGIAAEGQQYEEVMGQTADLLDLQRILMRSRVKLSALQQQNVTRWAVFTAGALLRTHKREHEAVMEAMARGASTMECVEAIEAVPL